MPPTAPQDHRTKRPTKKKAPAAQQMQSAPSTVPGVDRYAPTVWGSSGTGLEDLQMPSGQWALCRRPGVEGLIKAGVLHDIDTLSAIVDEKHVKRVEGRPTIDTESLLQDEDSILNVMHVVDRVVVYVVVKPEVAMAPNDPTSRKNGVIYTDMIDLEDRMFIFNYAAGGTRDLERFRQQRDETLGSVDNVAADESKTE